MKKILVAAFVVVSGLASGAQQKVAKTQPASQEVTLELEVDFNQEPALREKVTVPYGQTRLLHTFVQGKGPVVMEVTPTLVEKGAVEVATKFSKLVNGKLSLVASPRVRVLMGNRATASQSEKGRETLRLSVTPRPPKRAVASAR